MNEETMTIDLPNFCLSKVKFCKTKDFPSTDEEIVHDFVEKKSDRRSFGRNITEILRRDDKDFPSTDEEIVHDFVEKKLDRRNIGRSVTEIILRDDKDELLARSSELFVEEASNQEVDYDEQKENRDPNLNHRRSIISSLLQISCKLNSVECAKALIEGEAGSTPYIDELDHNGLTALHSAAEMHATECIELLLSKKARTDLRSKDGSSQIPLEMALSSKKIQELWSPDDSIEDLLINLSETDLKSIRILSEKTKGVLDVAYKSAMEGRVISLTALLMLASEKVTSPITIPRLDGIVGSKETTNIYECVIKEALSLSGHNGVGISRGARRILGYSSNNGEKRKLLLCEIEILQLFGATLPGKGCTEKRPISSLIRAAQAGDVAVLKLILKTNVDVNETDGEGNTALHWCLRTSSKNNNKDELNAWRAACLLLKSGAKVGKKNRLGLTSVHVAAANGYSQILQILLLKDPISVHAVSEMKETPLFYAVKNDFIDCAQILLRYGADSQKLNLRKQRAVDLAKSKDMRFMLSPSSIGFSSQFQRPRSSPLTKGSTSSCNRLTSYASASDSDSDGEMICEDLFNPSKEKTIDTDNSFDRIPPPLAGAKTEICRYFESPSGCVRGSKCHYAHGEAELLSTKRGLKHSAANIAHYSVAFSKDMKRKIFVGGLPSSIDSGTLQEIFEERFGPVDEAFVIGSQSSRQKHSRGFGFVLFKDEESVAAAVQAHYVTIFGKEVEIKGSVSKPIILEQQIYRKIINEKISWVEKLISSGTPLEGRKVKHQNLSSSSSPLEGNLPSWVSTFRKWFPGFLMDVSKRLKKGEWYPLSSVKGDFRATCGLELDHASLGYVKLSDFMRSFPGICSMKVVPVNGHGAATHMVLLPKHNSRNPVQHHHQLVPIPEQPPCSDDHDSYNDDQEDVVDYDFVQATLSNTCGYENFRCSAGSSEDGTGNTASRFMSTFLNNQKSFLQWDPLFHSHSWVANEGVDGGEDEGPENVLLHQTLRAESKEFSLFERQYDFYKNYRQCVESGMCFKCKRERVHWVNKPCGHFLWCSLCKEWANTQPSMMKCCYVCMNKITSCDYGAWPKLALATSYVQQQQQQQQQTEMQQVRHDGTNEIDYPPWNPKSGARTPKRRS